MDQVERVHTCLVDIEPQESARRIVDLSVPGNQMGQAEGGRGAVCV